MSLRVSTTFSWRMWSFGLGFPHNVAVVVFCGPLCVFVQRNPKGTYPDAS